MSTATMSNVEPIRQFKKRYYLAQTNRGIRVVSYKPDPDKFVAGPFVEKADGNEWLREQRTLKTFRLWSWIAGGLFVLSVIASLQG